MSSSSLQAYFNLIFFLPYISFCFCINDIKENRYDKQIFITFVYKLFHSKTYFVFIPFYEQPNLFCRTISRTVYNSKKKMLNLHSARLHLSFFLFFSVWQRYVLLYEKLSQFEKSRKKMNIGIEENDHFFCGRNLSTIKMKRIKVYSEQLEWILLHFGSSFSSSFK